jgi:hypothetical protein
MTTAQMNQDASGSVTTRIAIAVGLVMSASALWLAFIMPPARYPDTASFEKVFDAWRGRQVDFYPGRPPGLALLIGASRPVARSVGLEPDRIVLVVQALLVPIGLWLFWALLGALGLRRWGRIAALAVFAGWVAYWQYTHTVLTHPLANAVTLAFVVFAIRRQWMLAGLAGLAWGLTRFEGIGIAAVTLTVEAFVLYRGRRQAQDAEPPLVGLGVMVALFCAYLLAGAIRIPQFNFGDEQLAYNWTLTAVHCGIDLRPEFPTWTPDTRTSPGRGYELVAERRGAGWSFKQVASAARRALLTNPARGVPCLLARVPLIIFDTTQGLQEWAAYGESPSAVARVWAALQRATIWGWFLVPAVALATAPFSLAQRRIRRAVGLTWLVVALDVGALGLFAAGVEELSRHRVNVDALLIALAAAGVAAAARCGAGGVHRTPGARS